MPDAITQREIVTILPEVELPGFVIAPPQPTGLVIFAHGSGSSRHSRRNHAVARYLAQAGLAAILFDLLTETEAGDRHNVFDIPLLGWRMIGAARWAHHQPDLANLRIGLFGASTGAAAALHAAAELNASDNVREHDLISAVVSRGGRPDLAGDALPRAAAPTLLIVGSNDPQVLQLNRDAQRQLTCTSTLKIIEGATHLFEEPGALEQVAELAREWFVEWGRRREARGTRH